MITPEDEKLVETGIRAAMSEALRPFTELMTKLFGSAAEEIGLGWGAGLAAWRIKRQVRFWQKTQQFLTEAGIEPQNVPLKSLLPIVQNASIEEEDSLQDLWAALLANAAHPDSEAKILPSFAEKLKQLSSSEAIILERMHAEIASNPGEKEVSYTKLMVSLRDPLQFNGDVDKLLNDFKTRESFIKVCIDNLKSLRLIKMRPKSLLSLGDMMPVMEMAGDECYEFTLYGKAFFKACHPPIKKQKADLEKE